MAPGKLFIGNLPDRYAIEKRQLENIFGKYGEVIDCWVARSPAGFGFITFADEEDARTAKREMDGERVEGSRIRVEYSRQSVDKGSGRGGKGGGGRGRGRSLSRSRSRSRRRRSPKYESRGRDRRRDDSRSRGR